MSLTFTALPVLEGDAFLLQVGDWNCLFDSGVDEKVKDILSNTYNITRIDLAICSHNDKDHAEGFKELLQSKIKINEIWLPSFWASILKFVTDKRNFRGGCFDIDRCLNSIDPKKIKYVNNDSDLDSLFDDETVNELDLDRQLSEFFRDYEYNYRSKTKIKNPLYHIIENAYGRLINIVNEAYKNGCKIRWFQSTGNNYTKNQIIDSNICNNLLYNTSFIALNSLPICNIKLIKTIGKVIQALLLTTVNRYSLVFEFCYNDIHVVRFSADSDLYCQSIDPYPNEIIITAPHHGSDKNANVYKNIKGNDIHWVRTYHKKVQVGCAEFLNQNNRYCVKCPLHNNNPQDVSFYYQNGKWNKTAGMKCKCP